MPTLRETILTALQARLKTLAATALRGDVLPERIPSPDPSSEDVLICQQRTPEAEPTIRHRAALYPMDLG